MNEIMSPYWLWESELPNPICEYIIKFSESNKYESGRAGFTEHAHEKRDTDIQFHSLRWINAMLFGYIQLANANNFDYDIVYDREDMQISKYSEGQFYDRHTDFAPDRNCIGFTRKLSLSVQLSEEDSYEGGDLILYLPPKDEFYIVPKKQGTIIVFDSRFVHEVTSVKSGKRFSLVKWAHGFEGLK